MRAILTWHSIDASGSAISVAPARFREQVAWIAAAGVPVVSVEALLAMPVESDALALTFDDGFANFATEAAPLLRDRDWPVTLFVVSDRVGGENDWGAPSPRIPRFSLLDWDALGRLAEQGVEIGNHTRSHPRLPAIGTAQHAEEIGGAAARIAERLGRVPRAFAYPYGAHDQASVAAARAAHAWGVTTEFRALGPAEDALVLPRLDAWYFRRRMQFTGWGGPRVRGWIWARRQARRARRLLEREGGA